MTNRKSATTKPSHSHFTGSRGFTIKLPKLITRSRISKSHADDPSPQPPQMSTSRNAMIYLRADRRLLRLFPDTTAGHPISLPVLPPAGTTGILNVIIANREDLQPFSGSTVDWLIEVAHFVFEPLGSGSLYTFTTHTLGYWLTREMDHSQWRVVSPGENLMATIYEFRRANDALITLTQMSLPQQRSHTTNTSGNRSTQFRDALLQRDQTCIIISRQSRTIASHLIPRRLGDPGVGAVFQRFTPPGSAMVVDRYDPRLGVMLFRGLDSLVDTYDLGFWNTGHNQYVVHDFQDAKVNIYGTEPEDENERMCHGTPITLSDNGSSVPLPPVGVFRWHYIQCVLKKFATPEFREFGNILYFVQPGDDSDDDDGDDDDSDRDFDDPRNIADPPYPGYFFDLDQSRELQCLEKAERQQAVLTWRQPGPK